MGSIIVAVFIIVALYAYNAYFKGDIVSTPPAAQVGADLVTLSNEISQATLSRDVFSSLGYRLLSDFSVPLQPQAVGRNNPFAPIGQE